ncbi:unnamed protein product, partial [Cuscuta europaea]
MNERGDTYYQA